MFVDEKRNGEKIDGGTVLLLAPPMPSIAGFLAFCESKEPSETYDWCDPHNCACAQYARAIGRFDSWIEDRGSTWMPLDKIAQSVRRSTPWPKITREFTDLAKALRTASAS